MKSSTTRRRLACLAGAVLCALASGCILAPQLADAVEGEYLCMEAEGAIDSPWAESSIVLRGGAGSIANASGSLELTYTLSERPSPWITLTLEDGSSLQLQYRRPGELAYYDWAGGVAYYRRVGK